MNRQPPSGDNTTRGAGTDPIEEIDLLMLYYGEHDDPQLPAKVAADPQLSARLEQLSRQLAGIEQAPLPDPGSDYPQRVWQQLVPELDVQANAAPPRASRWFQNLLVPRFSLAGLTALLAVAMLAFFMGQNMTPRSDPALVLDGKALLVRELARHLQQAEFLLTEVANNGAANASVSASAQPLLEANRLYRVAGGSQVNPQLSQLLRDMETLLVELANAPDGEDLGPLKNYVDKNLLFRVRTLRSSLTDDQRQRI